MLLKLFKLFSALKPLLNNISKIRQIWTPGTPSKILFKMADWIFLGNNKNIIIYTYRDTAGGVSFNCNVLNKILHAIIWYTTIYYANIMLYNFSQIIVPCLCSGKLPKRSVNRKTCGILFWSWDHFTLWWIFWE